MHLLRSLAASMLVAMLCGPVGAFADDDDNDGNAPFSNTLTALQLCGSTTDKNDPCKAAGYDALAAQLNRAIQLAVSKAPTNVRPLLRRDQAFFNEMITMAAREIPQSGQPEIRKTFEGLLRNRAAVLPQIGDSFGRSGVLGRWNDAFGSVNLMPADGGAYRMEVDMSSIYGPDDEQHWVCHASALLKPDASGWLTGALSPEADAVAQHPDTSNLRDADGKPSLPPTIRLRRQGDTLRVVAGVPDDGSYYLTMMPHCRSLNQITGSFFASGKPEMTSADKMDDSFTKPTFDCTRPASASDDEICSDPDLADNDQRLNRAWKTLLPRLDDVTHRALVDDQRHWVRSQANQYGLSLHPRMTRMPFGMHDIAGGRDGMARLQRARIALLEGFDETRKGLSGLWFGYTAVLTVKVADDGDLEAKGWKWEQLSWKDGCDYEMSGAAKGNTFRADDGGKNPDTLERDHATLIVNRRDDAVAKGRDGAKGIDEMKCRRSMQASSTARLFPAKPSTDIDVFSDRIY